MKRTVMLIIFLIFAASILLIYAISSQPVSKPALDINISPTQTVSVTTTSSADSSLYFSPDYIELSTSDSASLDIMINSGKNQITGIQLEIGYDPEVFSEIILTPGKFLPQATVLLNENDEKNGRVSYALVLPPSVLPISGTGTVVNVRLTKSTDVSDASNPTTISILPKSLVSAIGIEGSVLREVKNASVVYVSSSGPVSSDTQTPEINKTNNISPSL